MYIIAAGDAKIETQLDRLLDQLDNASEIDRSKIEVELVDLLTPKVKSMLRKKLDGLIDLMDLDSQTESIIYRAINESGVIKIKRSDAQGGWEPLVERLGDPNDPMGQLLWSHLSDGLRNELEQAKYLKAPLEQKLANELNQLISRNDFGDLFGLQSAGPMSQRDRTEYNAKLIGDVFPEIELETSQPDRNVLGYISSFLIPKLQMEYLTESGGPTRNQRKQWGIIRPIYNQLLNNNDGHPPDSQSVFDLYRGQLDAKFNPAKQWWDDQIKMIRPDNPFKIDGPPAYRDAKKILNDNGYDVDLWAKKNSPYYLPQDYLKPLGLNAIKNSIALMTTPKAPLYQPAAPQSQPEPTWIPDPRSSGPELYRQTVDQLYGHAGYGAELAVGEFLASNPHPNGAEVEAFILSQSLDIAEDIRGIGFENLAHEIDGRVLDHVRDPKTVPTSNAALWIRRVIFGRNSRRLIFMAS